MLYPFFSIRNAVTSELYASEKDNVVTMSKDKFEELINQVYQSGIADAKSNSTYNPFTIPNNPVPRELGEIPIRYTNDNPSLKPPYEVTCGKSIPPEPAPPEITYQYESFHKCGKNEF